MHNIFNQMAASEDLAMAIDLDGKDEKEYRLQQILDVVAERFQKRRRIYTRIGSRDLLAVNPSDQLPIYDRAVMVQYASQQQPPNTQEAHIFGIAAQTLGEIQNLDETGADNKSAILFCGEAGAGKTENVFHALRYLVFAKEQGTMMSGEKDAKNRIKFDVHLVDALQRVMAAFGSAKTLKNEHSTRHGYSLNVHYFRTLLVGISIDPLVPLELSRLIQQKKGERNFSVFYQLCSGIGPEEREKLGLKSATNYFYLNQGKCAGLELKKEAEQFVALCQALERIGFSEHQRQLIFRLLAVILHCGNLFFRAEKSTNADEANEPGEAEATEFAELANEAELRWIAMLLDVDFGQLWRLFTQGSPQGNRLSVDAALDRRDWFAKCIYGQLFRWLTSRISLFLRIPHENYSDNGNAKIRSQISLVDLPGHERYNNNDYEEFCVNLVSEKLERFFQQKVFGQFRDEELREARSGLAHNQWPNNERILDLLTGGPTGILPLLDDECKFPKGSDETFLQHCNINHLDKPIYAKARLKGRLEMGIRQHFGLAFYAVEGFLQRNRFMQPAAFLQVLSKSKDAALASIFSAAPERCAGGGDKWIHVANEWLRGMDRMGQQLAGSHLHFVRCVRANQERIAGKWDGAAVARQFKTLDLLDHCRAVRLAFPHKIPVPTFAHEFRVLLPSEIVRGQSARQTAKDVLVAQGVRFESHFVLGPLHVFLRDPLFAQLKTLLAFTKDFAAIVIQRNLRQFLGRRAYLLKRAAIIRLQAGYRGWKCRRKVAELRERLSWEQKFGRVESARKFRSRNGSRQQEAEEEEPSKSSAHRLSRQCLRDLPPNLRQLVVAHQEEQQKLGGQQQQQQQPRFKQHSKYTAAPKPNVSMAPVPAVDLEQFAAENFKTIILGHRLEPVETPFLPKDSEPEFQQSLSMFKLLLHYQHEPAGTDPELLAMLAKHIVQQAITMPSLRDELFAQLLNQNFDCQCETAKQRIWTLMLSAVHAFAPSSLMFPLLYSQFQAQPPALAQMLIAGLLQVSVLPEMASTNRTFAPTLIEQTAFERRQPTTLTVQFADRESLNVETNSWTTAEEMVQTVLRQRGIGDEFGWGLQLDDGVKCAELAAALFPLDAVAQLENGLMFLPVGMAAQSPFVFFDSAAADCKSAGAKETLAHDNAIKLDKCQQNGGMDQSNGSGMGSESRAWSRQPQHQPGAAQPFYRPDYQFSAPRQNGGSDFSTAGGGSQFVPPMMATASEPVRQRFDAVGIQMRRQANAHCMSRITEKDETESMVSSTLPRGGGNNSNNNNTLNRIRNMPIPDDNEDHQNVEHFLDNIFEQALPPSADYDRDNNNGDNSAEEKRRRAMVIGQLAASIKGGDFYQPIPVAVQNRPLQFGDHPSRNTGSFFSSREQQQQPMAGAPAPRRFIYRPGGDILLDNGNGNPTHQSTITNLTAARQPYESIGHGKSAPLPPPPPPPPPQYHQPNGAFVGSQPMRHLSMANQHANNGGATVPAMPQPPPPAAAAVFGGGGGLRRYNFFPAQHFQSSIGSADHSMDDSSELDDGPVHFGRPVNGDLRSPPPHDGNNRTKNNKYQEVGQPLDEEETDGGEEDTATLKSVDGGSQYGLAMGGQQPRQREEQQENGTAATDGLSAGNDWAPESEATLEALFSSSTGNGHQHRNVCANIYATSGRPKSKCGSDLGDPLLSGQRAKARKLPPALTYVDQPFQLFVRKQIFLPEDVLDEGLEIDLIFAQIIGDCRQRSQMRIRKYERESVNQLLRSYNVSPAMLNTPAQIGSNIKLELISIVRKWPLYFCRLFPCTEERPNGDRVPLLLGVGETGVRLIAITVGGGRPAALSSASEDQQQQQQQLTIQDHFEFSDIADLLQEHGGRALRLITRQHVAVLLTGPSLDQARQCIHQYLGIGAKRRQFVIAVAQYSTNEQNVLSFEAGDYIQLLDKPDSEAPKSAGTWFYGRLDGRFGWLPAEYVLDANSQEDQLYSASCNGLSMSESGGFSAVGASSFGTNGRVTLPPVLEPLFANLDPATLFLSAADHAGVDHFTMVEFAIRFFRRPKGESALGGKKHKVDPFNASGNSSWSWKEVTDRVKFTDKPIGHSLLRLESHEADRVAQQAFLCLMRFMGDESLKRNQSYTDCVYELLSLCHQYVLIRDEVYCQLLKQITANRSAKCNESALRGWRLLSIVCAYFQCSETLKPYLLKYLGDVAFDQRRTFNAMAKLCLYNLAQTYRYGGRRLVLGAAEVEAIANGLSVRRQWYNLPGGHRRQICTRAVTVAEEIVQALCLEMNIRGQAEQQEFTLCYMLQKDNSVRTLLNDEYLLDVLTDLETRVEDFLLILMRSVWLHPLRRDSELCTDALFFQLMPNYLAGLYTTLRADGSATASTLDQVATLLLLGDPRRQAAETGQAISPADLTGLVPKTVLKFAGISADQWAQRIRAKIEELGELEFGSQIMARQRFLEIVERWPLFGAAFYFVKRVFNGKVLESAENLLAEHCVLAVNKLGIRVLTSEMHQLKGEVALEEIREMAKYSVAEANFLELRLSPSGAQKRGGQEVVTVETDLGNEISRLVGHYIFLSGTPMAAK